VNHPVYLLSGQEFLVDEALRRVRGETGADPLNEVTFGARDPVAEVLNALETPSLLGGRRLVIVRDANDLLKETVDALARYIESPAPDSVLVLIALGRTRLDPVVAHAGARVVLDAPKGRRLVGWIRRRAAEHSLKIDDRAAWALIDSVGGELRDLDAALSQLTSALGAGAHVTAADVARAFPRVADQRIYVLTDAVGDRRLPVAMTNLRRLLEQGEDPLVLLGALAGQVRRMLRARRYVDAGTSAVADALGLPSWRAERLARQARAYREPELISAMGALAEADVEIKGGDLPPEAALERAVVMIVERPFPPGPRRV
jgi:DNA polymerase-3 subunit delta